MKTKYTNLAIYLLLLWVLLLLTTENHQNRFFPILIFNYSFWRNLHSQKWIHGFLGPVELSVFLDNFFIVAKSGDYPQEDLAKFGYKLNIKVNSLKPL
jgi:hypothetical protein